MVRKLCLLLFFSLALFAHGHAVDSLSAPTGAILLRPFDGERIQDLRSDPTLDYDKDLRRIPSPWERLKAWLWELLDDLLGSRAAGSISRNLLYALVVVILIFALVILSRGGLRRVFHGAPRSLAEVGVVTEDIRALDLGALIIEAERNGDLRRAIRLHYLLVLRKLVDQNVLHWSPDHTDRDYMAQIKDPGSRARFTHIALVFQRVWYGHAEVGSDQYADLSRPFIEFGNVPVS